jgi:hypothetical protein
VVLVLPSGLYAQINTDELQKGQGQVEFQNYTGPVTRVDTRAQIRAIGYPLGTAVKSGAARSGSAARYFVIHSVSGPEGARLDADIFGLGPGVGVDHIRNLRLILQGYLEGAYDYSASDAGLLAHYITVYNAVFRGNTGYFNDVYKRPVTRSLTPGKAGLSTRFNEWPDRTLMVIPLRTAAAGSASALDTSSLSDPRVIDEMRKDDDVGADQRTAMADLKDREAAEAEAEAQRRRDAIAAEEARLAAEREAFLAERERLAREREALGAREAAEREAEAARRAKELADREAALAAEREAAQKAEDFADQKRAEAEQDRKTLAQETGGDDDGAGDDGAATAQTGSGGDDGGGDDGAATAQAGGGDDDGGDDGAATAQTGSGGGDDGAGDDSAATAQAGSGGDDGGGGKAAAQTGSGGDGGAGGKAAAQTGGDKAGAGDTGGAAEPGGFVVREDGDGPEIVGMIITGQGSTGTVVKVHPSTSAELRRSRMNTINIRTVTFIDNRIIALAGQGGAAMRLIEIDADTLEVKNQGDDDIAAESLVWAKGAALYAIILSGGNRYLGRFNLNLARQAQSEVPVHPYAALNFQGDMLIITQRNNGQVLLLDPVDLTEGR